MIEFEGSTNDLGHAALIKELHRRGDDFHSICPWLKIVRSLIYDGKKGDEFLLLKEGEENHLFSLSHSANLISPLFCREKANLVDSSRALYIFNAWSLIVFSSLSSVFLSRSRSRSRSRWWRTRLKVITYIYCPKKNKCKHTFSASLLRERRDLRISRLTNAYVHCLMNVVAKFPSLSPSARLQKFKNDETKIFTRDTERRSVFTLSTSEEKTTTTIRRFRFCRHVNEKNGLGGKGEKLQLEKFVSHHNKSRQIKTLTLLDEITHLKPVWNLMNQLTSSNSCSSFDQCSSKGRSSRLSRLNSINDDDEKCRNVFI